MKTKYTDFILTPEQRAKLAEQGVKISVREIDSRGGGNASQKVQKAVLAYLAITKPKRGDLKKVAIDHDIPVSSLASQLRRRATRKEFAYPSQYEKAK